MNEPWFDPQWAFLPGTLLGGVGGPLIGILGGLLVPRGKAKVLVMGICVALTLISFIMLMFGITALLVGQPNYVWYSLMLAGGIGTILFGGGIWLFNLRYREAELRKLHAGNL